MTTSKTTLFYDNGPMWRTVVGSDGKRVVRPFGLTDVGLVIHTTKETRQR